MAAFDASSIKHILLKQTSFFGLKLWVAITTCTVLALVLLLVLTFVYISCRFRTHGKKSSKKHAPTPLPNNNFAMERRQSSSRTKPDIETGGAVETTGKKHVMYYDHWPSDDDNINSSNNNNNSSKNNVGQFDGAPEYVYKLREIEEATNGLAYDNIIGTGEYGVVFHGWLRDSNTTQVAVKKLFNNRGRGGRKAFAREVEALLSIRHRNLVKLLGYCAEGTNRVFVNEYVDNGNLDRWLHRCTGEVKPLTWNVRMSIIIGIAKGLAYLHEDTEPPLVHGNLKSSNVLLDQQWNPKISDFGITKFLGHEWKNTSAPPKGMSGYIAPEYDSIRYLNEKSDIYSYGVLIMEIVSGKSAIESTVNEIEEYLVDWMKSNVADENFDLIIDPKLPELPSIKELKRVLLVALRCVDFEIEKRPKIGEILCMLQPRDLLLTNLV
ncbi:hypothetical protein ABFS82_06G028700 [Erythranthe guttata]|nr:PREDICTED: probable serine/threonine-protein kinase At1g01540 [Erythranthe guttata]|eukprot:XP_012851930.1 PREDICTED: probable serine/threonine-protein kinase At1g01540 [Erythranthe guttata]